MNSLLEKLFNNLCVYSHARAIIWIALTNRKTPCCGVFAHAANQCILMILMAITSISSRGDAYYTGRFHWADYICIRNITLKKWWAHPDSNQGQPRYERGVLTAELWALMR